MKRPQNSGSDVIEDQQEARPRTKRRGKVGDLSPSDLQLALSIAHQSIGSFQIQAADSGRISNVNRSTNSLGPRDAMTQEDVSRKSWSDKSSWLSDLSGAHNPRGWEQRSDAVMLNLRDIVAGPVDKVANCLRRYNEDTLEGLRVSMGALLGSADGKHEFAELQALLDSRKDLVADNLKLAEKTQLQILVAVRTGIQAFLHPDIFIVEETLAEIFLQQRCRNVACQSQLPADGCACQVCSSKGGFCNLCMCVACSKFDFDANTCRWIGCDFCLHWSHTDCAIRMGYICAGPSLVDGASSAKEMQFRCSACTHTSELFGFVKDVFRLFAPNWEPPVLARELDCVRRIFHGSQDARGQHLYARVEELTHQLESGRTSADVCDEICHCLAELEDSPEEILSSVEVEIPPSAGEECRKLINMVKDAVKKIEADTDEKRAHLSKAKVALEKNDRELEMKRSEAADIAKERLVLNEQMEELETIVRIKHTEADMFQAKADAAKREAEGLLRIIAAKVNQLEEEHTGRYLALKLDETEAKRKILQDAVLETEKAKLQLEATKHELSRTFQQLIRGVEVAEL